MGQWTGDAVQARQIWLFLAAAADDDDNVAYVSAVFVSFPHEIWIYDHQ